MDAYVTAEGVLRFGHSIDLGAYSRTTLLRDEAHKV